MRQTTVETIHDDSHIIAAALRPANTADMSTRVDSQVVTTTITRDSTSSLRSTVDNYVTNLTVAQQVIDTTIQS